MGNENRICTKSFISRDNLELVVILFKNTTRGPLGTHSCQILQVEPCRKNSTTHWLMRLLKSEIRILVYSHKVTNQLNMSPPCDCVAKMESGNHWAASLSYRPSTQMPKISRNWFRIYFQQFHPWMLNEESLGTWCVSSAVVLVNDVVYSGTLFWEQEQVYYPHSD